MADENDLNPGAQKNIPRAVGKMVPKARPTAMPSAPDNAPQTPVQQARPNPRPGSARIATASAPSSKPASARLASPGAKRPSARKMAGDDYDDAGDYGDSAAADKKKQIMIIGGVVGGVVLLILILIIAAGGQQKHQKKTDDGGGGRGGVGGFDSDKEALQAAGDLHAEGGRFARMMYDAVQAENREDGKKYFLLARAKYDQALEIYKQLSALYPAKDGYTQLEENIRALGQEIEDLQKGAQVWDD
jgi:hypothetical protein